MLPQQSFTLRLAFILNLLIAATSSVSLPGLPAGCMTSHKGISWGWLPDDGNIPANIAMSTLNADTGKKGCFYGDYSKVYSSNYDGSDINKKGKYTQGAIMVPSIMPLGVKWNEIDDALAEKIVSPVKQIIAESGQASYLRFAHEMNYYVHPTSNDRNNTYPGGYDYPAFIQAWRRIADKCHAIKGCYMFWCPNHQDISAIHNWYPGDAYVDIIGVDSYPHHADLEKGFAHVFDEFYNTVVKGHNKPFLIGETGSTESLDVKNTWVKDLTNGDFSQYPLYKGVMWFEYDKGGNGYVVYKQNHAQGTTFASNFK